MTCGWNILMLLFCTAQSTRGIVKLAMWLRHVMHVMGTCESARLDIICLHEQKLISERISDTVLSTVEFKCSNNCYSVRK